MILYLLFACTSTNERGKISSSSKRAGVRLEVSVTPSDAIIEVDGLPWNGERLSKGVHQLSVDKEGYHRKEQLLSISDLSVIRMGIQLTRNDVPLHFYYPIEQKLVLSSGEKDFDFYGSATLSVPLGPAKISTENGDILFEGNIQNESHIHRCPKPKEQKSYCVREIQLASAPLDFDFCRSSLWMSTLSQPKALYSYSLQNGTLTDHMQLPSAARIQCHDEQVLMLYENGDLYSYDPKSKKNNILHSFQQSWLTGFLIDGKTIYASSWFSDKVLRWDGEGEKEISVPKPKYMFASSDDAMILGSEPGALYNSDGARLWNLSSTNFVHGSMDKKNNELWLLDAQSNSIKHLSLQTKELSTRFTPTYGILKDLIVTEDLMIVLLHHKEYGFSLGRGVVQIFDKEKQAILDEIKTVHSPSTMVLGKKSLLAVGDISTKKVQLFDLSPLMK